MSLTADEVVIINQALDKIGSLNISYASQATVEGVKANTCYSQTRDSLLRSYDWNFAIKQENFVVLNLLTVDVSPSPSAWSVGATITGETSGATATVVQKLSALTYVIAYLAGTFALDETITDGTNSRNCDPTFPTVAEYLPLFHYKHQYQLPTDFLRFSKKYHYSTDYTIQGNRMLSYGNTASIEYVGKITDPNEFDPLFTEVLILQLALKLIGPIAGTNTNTLKADIKQDLFQATKLARTVCKNEINTEGRSDWNLARFNGATNRMFLR